MASSRIIAVERDGLEGDHEPDQEQVEQHCAPPGRPGAAEATRSAPAADPAPPRVYGAHAASTHGQRSANDRGPRSGNTTDRRWWLSLGPPHVDPPARRLSPPADRGVHATSPAGSEWTSRRGPPGWTVQRNDPSRRDAPDLLKANCSAGDFVHVLDHGGTAAATGPMVPGSRRSASRRATSARAAPARRSRGRAPSPATAGSCAGRVTDRSPPGSTDHSSSVSSPTRRTRRTREPSTARMVIRGPGACPSPARRRPRRSW